MAKIQKKVTSKKNLSKLKRIIGWLKPTNPLKGMVLFAILFVILGGSYYAYRSFAATPRRQDVFYASRDNSVSHMWWDGSKWNGPDNLGGKMGFYSKPVAVSWSPGRIDVFITGTDSQLWHKWYQNGWSNWEALGGKLTSNPTVASWGPGRLDVFARGTDNGLWHKAYSGGWSNWEAIGGVITADPSATSMGYNRIDVVSTNTHGHLIHKWWDGHSWSPGFGAWETLDTSTYIFQPAISSWGWNRLDIFAKLFNGGVVHKVFNGSWSGMTNMGSGVGTSVSAVAVRGNPRIDLYGINCTASNTCNVAHKWYESGNWSVWENPGTGGGAHNGGFFPPGGSGW